MMNRRAFAAGLVLAFTPAGVVTGAMRATDRRGELQQLFISPVDAMAIGERCRVVNVLPEATDALWRALGVLDPGTANLPLSNLFHAQRASDFAEGRLVQVDGWYLARAEVAALKLLVQAGPGAV